MKFVLLMFSIKIFIPFITLIIYFFNIFFKLHEQQYKRDLINTFLFNVIALLRK